MGSRWCPVPFVAVCCISCTPYAWYSLQGTQVLPVRDGRVPTRRRIDPTCSSVRSCLAEAPLSGFLRGRLPHLKPPPSFKIEAPRPRLEKPSPSLTLTCRWELMDVGADSGSPEDVQTQVLQTTLAEIETSRQVRAGSASGNPKDPHSSSSSSRCCVVCLESVSEPCAALPCGHDHFDFLCLVSWLQEHPNCPLCKANVYKVRYTDSQKVDAVYRVPNASRPRDETVGDGDGYQATEEAANPTLVRRRFRSQNGFLREASPRHPRPPLTEDEAVRRRRHIYRHQLYSLRL